MAFVIVEGNLRKCQNGFHGLTLSQLKDKQKVDFHYRRFSVDTEIDIGIVATQNNFGFLWLPPTSLN